MIVTVRFPVLNDVRIFEPIPIKDGRRTYFIEHAQGKMTKVGVRFEGAPPDAAPTMRPVDQGKVKLAIDDGRMGEYILLAERDLRAWQGLIAPIAQVRFDFDSPQTEFSAEEGETKDARHIGSFSTTVGENPIRSLDGDFSIAGRAFYAIEAGVPLIEAMSFYLKGDAEFTAGRYIDAYNSFYLFIETQFVGNTGTPQATATLLATERFVDALDRSVLEAANSRRRRPSSLDPQIAQWSSDKKALVKAIVELRGRLRHHSLQHKDRWDPTKRGEYENEAHFLLRVVHKLAAPHTIEEILKEEYGRKFGAMAQQLHYEITIHSRITAKFGDQIREVGIDMKFPHRTPNLHLARAVLDQTMKEFDERSPGAELIAIRAYVKASGVELLRYDVGASLPR